MQQYSELNTYLDNLVLVLLRRWEHLAEVLGLVAVRDGLLCAVDEDRLDVVHTGLVRDDLDLVQHHFAAAACGAKQGWGRNG